MKFYCLFLLILCSHLLNAQSFQLIDSLENVLKSDPARKEAFEANLALSAAIMRYDTSKYLVYIQQAESLANNDCEKIKCANQNLRFASESGKSDQAEELITLLAGMDYSECPKSEADVKVSEGNHFDIIGDYPKALEAYLKAEKIFRSLDNQRGLGVTQMGIGNIYTLIHRNDMAIKYYKKSWLELKDIEPLYASWSVNNMATCYTEMGKLDSAIFYFKQSLQTKIILNDEYGASFSYTDLGDIYYRKKEYDKALTFLLKAKEIKDRHDGVSDESKATNHRFLGLVYWKLGELDKAKEFLELAVQQSESSAAVEVKISSYEALAQIEAATGSYERAYQIHLAYSILKDSLTEKNSREALLKLQTEYELEEKIRETELIKANLELSQTSLQLSETNLELSEAKNKNVENENAKFQIYIFISVIVAILLGVLGIILFNLNRVKKKNNDALTEKNKKIASQRDEIALQKDILEHKTKEILDSISYAKRIQSAILPSIKTIEEHLKDSFVFYLPKDIVAGDFYWLEPCGDSILFAAADCTGHGVPGAMVSVICNNGLNRSVREYGINQPGEILDKTREIVISEFEKSEEDVKDGMDIALCKLNTKSLELEWAGANNPLWIIRSGNSEIEEIKANKQPIGKYENPTPFTNHSIQLNKGDQFFVFSDGFQDQFGGPRGKKFKPKQLKELLIANAHLTSKEQLSTLKDSFETWKGDYEQLDDVCIIGVKV